MSETLEVDGYCPICEKAARFVATTDYLRSSFRCTLCNSVPRERAIMYVIMKYFPNWRDLHIHESSGNWMGASLKLMRECSNYTHSQYDPALGFGNIHDKRKYVSQDLESQTFGSDQFDIVITQDVFEHLFQPNLAIKEIARTLKIGGAHICTFPIVRKNQPSRRRAVLKPTGVLHLLPAEYHGNPMDSSGSLVTIDWGWDVANYFNHHSGLSVTICDIEKLDYGIKAQLNEVLVCFKQEAPLL